MPKVINRFRDMFIKDSNYIDNLVILSIAVLFGQTVLNSVDFYWLFIKIPESPETFQKFQKFYRLCGNFPDSTENLTDFPKTFQTV